MNYSLWIKKKVNPLDLTLDALNPRVILNSNASQEEIRNFLIEYYDVLELVKAIKESKGLSPADNIIVTTENSKIVVLEGNRRTLACQILLNPNLVDEKIRKKLKLNAEEAEEYLSEIEVVVAPSREDAEPIITLRHSDYGTKKWSRLSNVNRIMIRYRQGMSIDEIAKLFNMKKSQVDASIRFHYFMDYVQNQLEWSEKELTVLKNPTLETSTLERFFPDKKHAKELFLIEFTTDYKMTTKIPKKIFDEALKNIVEAIYFENNEKRAITTRTSANKVFSEEYIKILLEYLEDQKKENENTNQSTVSDPSESYSDKSSDQEQNKEHLDINPTGNNNKSDNNQENQDEKDDSSLDNQTNEDDEEVDNINQEKSQNKNPKKPDRRYLYENLAYNGVFTGISRALYELQKINYKVLPLTATYLVRTLLESTLQAYLDIKNYNYMDNGKDPSLTTLIKFYVNKNVLLNENKQLHSTLVRFRDDNKANHLNAIVHAKYVEPQISVIEDIERETYHLVNFLIKEIKKNS